MGGKWSVSFMARLSCCDKNLIYNKKKETNWTYSKDARLVQNMSQHLGQQQQQSQDTRINLKSIFIESHKMELSSLLSRCGIVLNQLAR